MFFGEQTAQAVQHAVEAFETEPERYDPFEIRRHAEEFSAATFRSRMGEVIDRARADFALGGRVEAAGSLVAESVSGDGGRPAPSYQPN